ncbi:MAG: ATP-binding cassette domain-containing protein [Chloroflexota bacterium]
MIEIKDLSIELGEFHLKDINLSINDMEYFVILGPTGAGKTILLECIAGLHKIKQGEIWINGNEITSLAPEERKVGYVPQDYVLFPFLSVADNIAFGLKEANYTKTEIKKRVDSLAHLMAITHLLNRDTRSLSGGEKQRAALARALALSPKILLLDEPLCALDLQTAKYLRLELKRIHDELGITTIHITHDQTEAEEIADRLGVLNMGKIEQVGIPDEVFFYPGNKAVSDFIGSPNILECDCCNSLGQGLMEVDCGGLRIVIPHDGNSIERIALFPRDIYISDTQPPGPHMNRFKGVITEMKSYGTTERLLVKVGDKSLQTEIPHDISRDMNLAIGKDVFLILKLKGIKVYECLCNHSKNKKFS